MTEVTAATKAPNARIHVFTGDEVKALAVRLKSIADHRADILTPREIDALYRASDILGD